MYKDLSQEILNKLLEEKLIKADIKEEALKTIQRELNNNLGLEDYYITNVEELENYNFVNNTIYYHGNLLKVDNYYYDCSKKKLVIISNDKEYSIGNDLNLVVAFDEMLNTQIFDVTV